MIPSGQHKICHARSQFSQPVAITLNLYKKKKKGNIQFVFILSTEKTVMMPKGYSLSSLKVFVCRRFWDKSQSSNSNKSGEEECPSTFRKKNVIDIKPGMKFKYKKKKKYAHFFQVHETSLIVLK